MILHFSVDDFIDAFLDLKEHTYKSVFEQETFSQMRCFHQMFGFTFSCYCFYESQNGNLSEIPARYAEEFQENASWLRFGFHGRSAQSNYCSTLFSFGELIDNPTTAAEHYDMVIEQLVRITGGGACIDRFPRIHYYAGSFEICRAWKKGAYGIQGLISAEDNRMCYYHNEAQWAELINGDYCFDKKLNIGFWRTSLRLEDIKDERCLKEKLSQLEDKKKCLIFTHEPCLKEKRIEQYMLICGEVATEKSCGVGYFYEI